MSNLRADVIEAVYGALNVSSVSSLGTVYQHVPENTQPPCVLIRDLSLADEGAKDLNLARATIKVEAYYRGQKGTAANQIADAAEAALRAGFSSAAVIADTPEVESDGGEQGEDGVTYVTTIIARALVQPA